MKFIFVYITTKDKEQAENIAKALLEQNLAACANIVEGMNSIYRWEGKIVQDNECILIAKTREEYFERLAVTVKELHSYTCPCIVALPLVAGDGEYLKWIENETEQG